MNHTKIKQQEGERTMDQRVGWGFHHVMEPHNQPTSQSTQQNYEGWKVADQGIREMVEASTTSLSRTPSTTAN